MLLLHRILVNIYLAIQRVLTNHLSFSFLSYFSASLVYTELGQQKEALASLFQT